ncbi:MAG: nucleoside deaminase [Tannerellaceae bacterium]|jgi:tRNA(adenine34) deaminase|nr:nucleoside deaminase [Tannerellaceae bacterium]
MTPFDDARFMKEALAEAALAAGEGEVPVGALVVLGDSIIARAHNMTERLTDPTAHAEMLAVTSAAGFLGAKYLVDCRLYVTLEPCVMCAGAAAWAHMGAIIYGAPDYKKGFSLYSPLPLHPKTVVRGGIMEKECAALITAFFSGKRGR